MITLQEKNTQIDSLLNEMAEEIQLDDSRYDRMKSSYQSIKDWVESDEIFFKPYHFDVYPHGSVRILTTTKPLNSDEFDLDIAVHIKSNVVFSPERIYSELERRIKEHGVYKKMVEPKNRCLRLRYAGDFHMDILPGVQEFTYDQNRLKVPDKDLGRWVSSNPRGYASWFIDRANTISESLLEKALKAEKLPADNFKYKKPLQRGVQLIKRYRDLYFQNNDTDYRTSSIILTTIAGQYYNGEESIFNAIDGIITRIKNSIGTMPINFRVLNPVNQQEDFTDKWQQDNEYYYAFKRFAIHLFSEWQLLKAQNGIVTEGRILKGLFGNDLFEKAQKNQTSLLEGFRSQSLLRMDHKGILTTNLTASSPIKQNTFFGD